MHPGHTALFFKYTTEVDGFSALIDVILHLCNLQVFSIESQMVIEHLGENAQHSGLVLVNGSFNIDIEQYSLSLFAGGPINQHEGGRIVSEFLPEHLHNRRAVYLFVLQNVGEHFKQVGFTTAKEAG